MSKSEANLSLFIITIFAGIQYVFLSNIPSNVSSFAFLFITNLIGFLIVLLFFFRELVRIEMKQVLQGLLLAILLLVFNLLLLFGSLAMDPSTISFVLASYFIFIPFILVLLFKEKIPANILAGAGIVLVGLILTTGIQFISFTDKRIIFLLAASAVFALYIITVDRICSNSSPAILAMGQLFFGFIISGIGWLIEIFISHSSISVPDDTGFWGSVLFVSFFIRGVYTVVQTYAQRYVSAMNTSLIFSAEIIITLLASPFLVSLYGGVSEKITVTKLSGCGIIMIGILIAGNVFGKGLKPLSFAALISERYHDKK